jgi:hypothetical protein
MGYYYVEDTGDVMAKFMIYGLIVFAIVMAIYYMMLISLAIGALVGGGNAIYNYGVAFVRNVKPDRALRSSP